MKIKDLTVGMIVWHNNDILGITGATLPKEFDDFEVAKVIGNYFDYIIVFKNKEERKQFNEIMKEVRKNERKKNN